MRKHSNPYRNELSVQKGAASIPSVLEVLSTWIKKDFEGSNKLFAEKLGLNEKDLLLKANANGDPVIFAPHDHLFDNVMAGYFTMGAKLARLISPHVPIDILKPGTYPTETGAFEFHNFNALNFYEYTTLRTTATRQRVDISEEKFTELQDKLKRGHGLRNEKNQASQEDLAAYRKTLWERIGLLEKEFNRKFPSGFKGQKIDQQKIVENISTNLDIKPWELFAYVPIDKRRSEFRQKPANWEKAWHNKYFTLDMDNVIRGVSEKLFLGGNKPDAQSLKFFDLSHNILSKDIPYDVDLAIIEGPAIPLGQIYRYKRQFLGKSAAEVSGDLNYSDQSITEFEQTAHSGAVKEKLDRYYGFNGKAADVLNARYDLLLQERQQEQLAQSRAAKVQKYEERHKDKNAHEVECGALLEKIRVLRLKLTLPEFAKAMGYAHKGVAKKKETDNQVTLKDVDKLCAIYGIAPDDAEIGDLTEAVLSKKIARGKYVELYKPEDKNKPGALLFDLRVNVLEVTEQTFAEVLGCHPATVTSKEKRHTVYAEDVEKIRVKYKLGKSNAAVKNLLQAIETHQQEKAFANSKPLTIDKAFNFKTRRLEPFVGKIDPVHQKREEELSPTELSRLTSMQPNDVAAVLNRLHPVQNLENTWYDPKSKTRDFQFVCLQIVTSNLKNGNTVRCLRENSVEMFKNYYGQVKDKNESTQEFNILRGLRAI